MARSRVSVQSRSRQGALLATCSPDILPLFVADELAAIDRIERARAELVARISGLPPYSHKRIALEGRLASLTVEALRLETALEGRR